ncbi:MAG: hypothetical protein F6K62_27410, partial [Sphaerospermopsis sp. SIO1G2]|nr:hypothetical protein [Sphaerospermopsis sp. SIO1G2]
QYFETMYYGKNYQMGSLATGHGYNLGGFKILTYNKELGADFIIPSSNGGAPKYSRDPVKNRSGKDQIGQYKHLAVWLNQGGKGMSFLHPRHAEIDQRDFATIIKTEQSYVALVPINLAFGDFADKIGRQRKHPVSRLLQADKVGDETMGVVMVTGEGDYDTFVQMVADGTISEQNGTFTYQCGSGTTLAVAMTNSSLPQVWRDGTLHDWQQHYALFQPASRLAGQEDAQIPCYLGWKERKMHVEAGGHTFSAELKDDGTYIYSSTLAE